MKTMLPTLIAALFLRPSLPVETWYGTAELQFHLSTKGNPYDPDVNNVKVLFTQGDTKETRLAYYDGSQWHARLVSQHPGAYRAVAYLNGKQAELLGSVTLSHPLNEPYVRLVDGHFATSDGKPFWPIGHSLAWQNGGQMPLTEQLGLMGKNGVTWTRIWATYWDGRNPYWTKDGLYSQSALEKWDAITRAAENAGVRFQWTLHHHGQVSSTVNPNWPDHPWNVKNGGFLKTAAEFFTNPEAKRLTKAYLRYIVARYADSPAIMAWELFNEVQFSDAAQQGHWDTVAAWHQEMASYLRSIDPYHHLITTSSEIQQPIWTGLDYYQAHGYPASVPAMVLGDKFPKDKPYFWGEIGASSDEDQGAQEHLVVRDGIWSGVLAGNAGSAQYWNWDRMGEPHMYAEYAQASRFLKSCGFLEERNLVAKPASVETSTGAPLTFSPGLGWATSTVSSFRLPEDAGPQTMGRFSSFLQGAGHPEMSKPVVQFHFSAAAAGEFRFKVEGVSDSGTKLAAYVDGTAVKQEAFSAGSHPHETWALPFSAGDHTVTLKNEGADWVTVDGFSVDGIAPAISGSVLGNDHWLMARLQRGSTAAAPYQLTDLPLADGAYRVMVLDLDSGAVTTRSVTVTDGKAPRDEMAGKDAILVFRK